VIRIFVTNYSNLNGIKKRNDYCPNILTLKKDDGGGGGIF